MRITFALRADAEQKPGGDSRKVARYIDGLRSKGVEGTVVYSADDVPATRPDLVHLMNLDLPIENLIYARRLRREGRPFVLSTIRHPFEGVAKMYESGDDRFYRLLRGFGLPADHGVVVREHLKLAKRMRLLTPISFRSNSAAQHELLSLASAHLPMAPGERDAIRRDFGETSPDFLVPNGFSLSSVREGARSAAKFDLVSVGRIEPRKNALNLVRAVANTQLRLLIVGGENVNHPQYFQEFLRQVNANPRVSYVGPLDQTGVISSLRSASAYVNAAWFEVVSQADVEAATLGLPVLSTVHSYLDDILGPGHAIVDPGKIASEDAGEYLCSQIEKAKLASVTITSKPTWQDASDALKVAYSSTLTEA